MILALERAGFFIRDFELQAGWYVRQADKEVARRYLQALDATLQLLRVHEGTSRWFDLVHPIQPNGWTKDGQSALNRPSVNLRVTSCRALR